MAFQGFLDSNHVTDIPPELSQAMDSVGASALRAALALPTPVVTGILAGVVPPAVTAMTGAPVSTAEGLVLLMTAIETDVQSLIATLLAAGTISLASPAAIGVPGIPIVPAALASGPAASQPGFGKAALQWAVSLISPGDPRLISPITA